MAIQAFSEMVELLLKDDKDNEAVYNIRDKEAVR